MLAALDVDTACGLNGRKNHSIHSLTPKHKTSNTVPRHYLIAVHLTRPQGWPSHVVPLEKAWNRNGNTETYRSPQRSMFGHPIYNIITSPTMIRRTAFWPVSSVYKLGRMDGRCEIPSHLAPTVLCYPDGGLV